MKKPSTEPKREFALEVARRLRFAGYQSLWAGGCVRDLLLGREPNDYDVATDARPEQVKPLFRRTCEVGSSFGVMRILGPDEAGEVEVATFRSDGAYIDGRRPESVVFSSPELDAARRDFTINGMFLDPLTDDLIDYVGGRADLDAGILRAIGEPSERFREDKLRLLRAIRFATRFRLAIDPDTWAAIGQMAPEVTIVAAERIAQELRKILTHESRAEAMRLALESGLLRAILPEAEGLVGVPASSKLRPNGDHWDWTMQALENLPSEAGFPLALAGLLHNVGSPITDRTRSLDDATGLSHTEVGRRMAEEIGRRLRLSNAEIDQVGWLVQHHHSLADAARMRESDLKRLLASPWIGDLLLLCRADALANDGDTSQVDYCVRYLEELPDGPINPPPLVTGHDLMRHGLKPGPGFASYLDSIRTAQLDREISSTAEALAWLDRRLDEEATVQAEGRRDSVH